MLLKQDSATAAATTSGAAMPASTACGNCGLDERRLLHHVRHRGIFRRLCTSCVLRLHPQSFCPTCFAVYHPSPPPSGTNDAVTCFKCYSSSHSRCVGPNPPAPYICPLCINPNAPVAVLEKVKDLNLFDVDGRDLINENCRVIDKKAAKILFAAARIAAVSLSKAALVARAEAERRAKEAAFARKRAREALEHVTLLAAREKMKKNEAPLASSMEFSRNVNNSNNNNFNRVGNASSSKVVVGVVEEKNRVGNEDRMDSSNEVLVALNAVELREKEKLGGVKPQNVVPGPSSNNGVAMEVEENRGMQANPSLNNSGSGTQNYGGGNENERSGDSGHHQHDQGKKVNNGVVPLPPKEDQMQGLENDHAGRQDNNVSQR